ncbi:carotenoid oxygenase family protein [Streptomyces sp. NPDC058964]|uniref:carotenoid oxygenase family protein n=1 Tax=Streptomyces sp. NPDC058964 TaxID=3346681 RepID=UPI0036ACE8DE
MTVRSDNHGQEYGRWRNTHVGACCAAGIVAAGEAVSVPREPAGSRAAEDDGHAIAHVQGPDRGAADPVVRAAQDFTGEPVAHLPGRVPLGFHGNGIPDA